MQVTVVLCTLNRGVWPNDAKSMVVARGGESAAPKLLGGPGDVRTDFIHQVRHERRALLKVRVQARDVNPKQPFASGVGDGVGESSSSSSVRTRNCGSRSDQSHRSSGLVGDVRPVRLVLGCDG